MRIVLIQLLTLAFSLVPFATASENLATNANRCSKIEVRKEWRALSKKEKKAWIDAVNVSLSCQTLYSSDLISTSLCFALVPQQGTSIGKAQSAGKLLCLSHS
jgi:hypothetical protein